MHLKRDFGAENSKKPVLAENLGWVTFSAKRTIDKRTGTLGGTTKV